MKTISRKLTLFCPLLLLANAAIAAPDTPADNRDAPKSESEDREDKREKEAGRIISQPVRDVGIEKTKIPPVLITAAESPYAAPKGKCTVITSEMGQLNEALGPDLGSGTKENEDKVSKVASAGGSWVMNSLIPFRGLVREVSGAAPAERRLAAAVSAGMARRGYLRGLAQSRGCRIPG